MRLAAQSKVQALQAFEASAYSGASSAPTAADQSPVLKHGFRK